MKIITVIAVLAITLFSCTKQAEKQSASEEQTARGGKHGGGGGGSTSIPAPTGLTVTLASSGVAIKWDAVANATSYWIYRNNYVPAIVTVTSYTDQAVSPGTYSYAVAAVVNSTLGTKSNSVTITIP